MVFRGVLAPGAADADEDLVAVWRSRQVLQSGFVIFPFDRADHAGAGWSCAW